MSGRGSWPYAYQLGLDFRNDPQGRSAYGIYALKAELVYNGYADGIVVKLPYWGGSVTAATKAFQAAHGLISDGRLGYKTAPVLFKKRCDALELRYGIPDHLLARQKTLESNSDPVCQGTANPDDEGISQINLRYWPKVTQAQAWDPAWALDWQAKWLVSAFQYVSEWPGAIVSWNIGRINALNWVKAGKPASGGPPIGSSPDGWVRATRYLSAVLSRTG